ERQRHEVRRKRDGDERRSEAGQALDEAAREGDRRERKRRRGAFEDHPCKLRFASLPAISRAQSMKSCAIGLNVRFFNLRIPIVLRELGRLIGRTLSPALLALKVATDSGTMVRKRPVASSALRTGTVDVITAARGVSSPSARNASATIDPYRLSRGGSVQTSLIRSTKRTRVRRVHGFCLSGTTTSGSSSRASAGTCSWAIGTNVGATTGSALRSASARYINPASPASR